MHPHALRRDVLGRLDLETERVPIERQRGVEVARRRCRHDRAWPSSARASPIPVVPSRRVGSAPGCRPRRCRDRLARGDPIEQRLELAGRQHALVHVADEAMRQQVAHAPFRARAGAAPVRSARVRAGTARSRRAARRRPCRSLASVFTIGGRQSPSPNDCSDSIASIDATVRSAPSRSALFTTKMSAISMMPAFSACTSSPVPGTSRTMRDVGRADDVDFVLADADRLDEHDVLAGGVEHERGIAGRAREAAQVAARRHAADEHAGVGGVRLHADAIAEDGAAGERARRIDGDDADASARAAGARRSADRRACSCRRRAAR